MVKDFSVLKETDDVNVLRQKTKTEIKAYDLFWNLFKTNDKFARLVSQGLLEGKVRFFGDEEWNKIESQNFISPIPEMKEFYDMFILGYNIGNCQGTALQLSYSYNDVDIVSGILPILKGTLNAEVEGGHCWLETTGNIIDTTLMLVIAKALKEEFGYIEEQRVTASKLRGSSRYQARKGFVNDRNINHKNRS